jgi:DNA-binding NarL/FixJ family response regulator
VKRTKAIATPVQEVATFEQVIDKTMQAQFERDMQAIDDAAQAEVAGIDKRQRAMQLKSEGLSNATIAQELQVNPSTVSRWFKKVEA